jgi:hypothetical protein
VASCSIVSKEERYGLGKKGWGEGMLEETGKKKVKERYSRGDRRINRAWSEVEERAIRENIVYRVDNNDTLVRSGHVVKVMLHSWSF